MSCTVLMVAEKPSIASALTSLLGNENASQRRGASSACPVHEFHGSFLGKPAFFRVTSVLGHVYALDFLPQYQSWEATDPQTLFTAETKKSECNPKTHVCRHLQQEAKGSDYLVLWLDCDREGENICFEVMENTVRHLSSRSSGQKVWRARFSALSKGDVVKAMNSLVSPNMNEALSVDARQELDLKVGVAFTRFQTGFFQSKYGNLDARIVSYGPCQTPCLGFCVQRHDEIASFKPETFWTIDVRLSLEGTDASVLSWRRERCFDHAAAMVFEDVIKESSGAKVLSVESSKSARTRPNPLNTVEMLKIASTTLGMGPSHSMSIAEQLYTQGFISYPRTESTAYPKSFDLRESVSMFASAPIFGEYVRDLLDSGIAAARGGVDMGDHPPITPMRPASPSTLSGEAWRLYELVVRSFLASVSPNAELRKVTATFSIGPEEFFSSGSEIVKEGFLAVAINRPARDARFPFSANELQAKKARNELIPLSSVKLREGQTAPPGYLSESELISLMEKHGIGTDASISVHIANVIERGYVKIESPGRTVVPTTLGIVLVHGYLRIDPDLVLPEIRANIEKQCKYIADGRAKIDDVLLHSLRLFEEKFAYFKRKIAVMDELFQAEFDPLAESGKPFCKCGNCSRYMKLIPLRPQRLYCSHCDETYSLPQTGVAKLYKEYTCPLDGFELVLNQAGPNGKSFPLCPRCYSNPPFDEQFAKGCMNCTQCPHVSCRHSRVRIGVAQCEACEGVGLLVLDVNSAPNWHVDCNNPSCNIQLRLPKRAHAISVEKDVCDSEDCEARLVTVDFNKNTTPLPNGETKFTGCLFCDPLLVENVESAFSRRGGRGRRGRGRGRRGRGRGRGGRKEDVLMSFRDF